MENEEMFVNTRDVCLDNKVNNFVRWFAYEVNRNVYFCDYEAKRLRNFIEKMAVWYEIRYPDYEVSKLIPFEERGNKFIDEVMFKNNDYVNNNFDINSDVRRIKWGEFYNFSTFYDSLVEDEKRYFFKASYNDYTRLIMKEGGDVNIYLKGDGEIWNVSRVFSLNGIDFDFNSLIGINIKEAFFRFRDVYGCDDYQLSDVKEEIEDYDNQVKFRNGLFDYVMYRIIERGGMRVGARRGFIFAREFERSIDIPMQYGVDYSDQNMYDFIKLYLSCGGSEDVFCFVNYGSKLDGKDRLASLSVGSLLKEIEDRKKYLKKR